MLGRGPISSAPISAGVIAPAPTELSGRYRLTVPSRQVTFTVAARTVTFTVPTRTIRFSSGG
jgi:hypothetical protein